MSPLQDEMRRKSRLFVVDLLTHGNQKKTDRIAWALAGRFENGLIHLKERGLERAIYRRGGELPIRSCPR